jgi:hypothetical protein
MTTVAGSGESFSVQLERWLRGDDTKTLGALSDVSAEKSFAVTILLLMFVPALPLPTAGISHVFEAITVVLAGEMLLGRRTIWLPEHWQRRELGPTITGKAVPFMIRWIRRVEHFSQPRGAWLFQENWMLRLLGLLMMGLAIAAVIAPPFSGLDTLPSLGAVAVALSIILEDVVVLAIGIVIGAGGVVLILTIGAAIVRVLRNLI